VADPSFQVAVDDLSSYSVVVADAVVEEVASFEEASFAVEVVEVVVAEAASYYFEMRCDSFEVEAWFAVVVVEEEEAADPLDVVVVVVVVVAMVGRLDSSYVETSYRYLIEVTLLYCVDC
jgi:hypothetical protein